MLSELDDTGNYKTVAVVIAGWNSVIRNTDNYTGLFSMKLQQLKLLGYKLVVVSPNNNAVSNLIH